MSLRLKTVPNPRRTDITIDSRSKHISARIPAGKGAPIVSLRSKRSTALLANQRLKELKHCFRVYTEYLHGWNYEDNNNIDYDQFVYGWVKVPRNATVNEDLDDVVDAFQEFLSDQPDQPESLASSSQELAQDSMLPNHDLTNFIVASSSGWVWLKPDRF